jgi:hypothetical protein
MPSFSALTMNLDGSTDDAFRFRHLGALRDLGGKQR